MSVTGRTARHGPQSHVEHLKIGPRVITGNAGPEKCKTGKCQILTLPAYLTFGVGRLLHLPSAEAVSVRPNPQPRCNQKVTVIGCEAENRLWSRLNHQPPGTGDVLYGCSYQAVCAWLAPLLQIKKSSGSSVHKPHHHAKVADLGRENARSNQIIFMHVSINRNCKQWSRLIVSTFQNCPIA